MKAVVKSNVIARIGYFSVVTLMALSFSMKSVLAADDIPTEFKLWKTTPTGVAGEALKHISDEEKTDAKRILSDLVKASDVAGNTAKMKEFAGKFASEPFKFVEGIKEAWSTLNTDADKEAFKQKVRASLNGSDILPEFGTRSRQNAFYDLVNKLFNMGFSGEDLLKRLFEGTEHGDLTPLWPLLGVMKKPAASPTPTPRPSASPIAAPVSRVDEQNDNALEPLFGLVENLCRRNDNVQSPGPDAQVKALMDELKKLKDGMAELFSGQAQNPAVNPNQFAQKRAEKGIEDFLPLLNAVKEDDDRGNNATPTAQQPPTQSSRDRETDPQQLAQPLPEAPQQQQAAPFILPPQNTASSFALSPRGNDGLDATAGRAALRDADTIAFQNEMRQPIENTISQNAGIPELVMAKAKLKPQIQQTTVALNDLKDKRDRLEEDYDTAKEQSMTTAEKRKMALLDAEISTKKAEAQQLAQSAGLLQGENAQQAQSLAQSKQAEVQQLENQKKLNEATLAASLEERDAKLKSLKKRLDKMSSTEKKLESQLSAMKGDEGSLSQLISMNLSMQQQQPAGPSVQNVNNGSRVQGMSPRTSPRGLTPGLSTTAGSTSGSAYRGPLGTLGGKK